jgi:hypothetical protein
LLTVEDLDPPWVSADPAKVAAKTALLAFRPSLLPTSELPIAKSIGREKPMGACSDFAFREGALGSSGAYGMEKSHELLTVSASKHRMHVGNSLLLLWWTNLGGVFLGAGADQERNKRIELEGRM